MRPLDVRDRPERAVPSLFDEQRLETPQSLEEFPVFTVEHLETEPLDSREHVRLSPQLRNLAETHLENGLHVIFTECLGRAAKLPAR